MAVFRVEKTKRFTIMSNHHLNNPDLSLKAKGLLSLMLSLPEEPEPDYPELENPILDNPGQEIPRQEQSGKQRDTSDLEAYDSSKASKQGFFHKTAGKLLIVIIIVAAIVAAVIAVMWFHSTKGLVDSEAITS